MGEKSILKIERRKLYHTHNNQIFNVYVYFEHTSSLIFSLDDKSISTTTQKKLNRVERVSERVSEKKGRRERKIG